MNIKVTKVGKGKHLCLQKKRTYNRETGCITHRNEKQINIDYRTCMRVCRLYIISLFGAFSEYLSIKCDDSNINGVIIDKLFFPPSAGGPQPVPDLFK